MEVSTKWTRQSSRKYEMCGNPVSTGNSHGCFDMSWRTPKCFFFSEITILCFFGVPGGISAKSGLVVNLKQPTKQSLMTITLAIIKTRFDRLDWKIGKQKTEEIDQRETRKHVPVVHMFFLCFPLCFFLALFFGAIRSFIHSFVLSFIPFHSIPFHFISFHFISFIHSFGFPIFHFCQGYFVF